MLVTVDPLLVLGGLVAVFCALMGFVFGANKGQPWTGAALGMFGPVGLAAVFFLDDKRPQHQDQSETSTLGTY
jgi:hypothetical protein